MTVLTRLFHRVDGARRSRRRVGWCIGSVTGVLGGFALTTMSAWFAPTRSCEEQRFWAVEPCTGMCWSGLPQGLPLLSASTLRRGFGDGDQSANGGTAR